MKNQTLAQVTQWMTMARLGIVVGLGIAGVLLLLFTISQGYAASTMETVESGTWSSIVSATGIRSMEMVSRCFVGAYPYSVPPTGHYNTFVGDAINVGIYHDLMEMPLAIYKWADDTWIPYLATSWELVPPDRFTVNLRQGVKWSDGSDFTAQDVRDTFRVSHLQGSNLWNYLDRIEISGTHTVHFYMATPSTLVERYVLRKKIRAASVYGAWADSLQALVDQGKNYDSPEWQDLLSAFQAYRPPEMVVSGPYQIDSNSITTDTLAMVRNPTAWNASQIKFECIRIYNGESDIIAPLVVSKEIDYATHGFSPYWESRIISEGYRTLHPPIYSGPALYLNHAIYPFNVKQVRQAIAYAIDREENGTVSLGDFGVAVEYESGFSDLLTPRWMIDTASLSLYVYNTISATNILKDLGFTRAVTDGVWITDQGQRMVYTLTYPAEFQDWSATALNLANQLTTFGISITTQGVPYQQHPGNVNQGNFQLAILGWGSSNPHPYFAFEEDFFRHNLYVDPGISFPLTQETDCCGTIDLESEIYQCADGLDEETHKTKVTRIARAFNELLPIIPLWERYGNNPIMVGHRVIGWPDDSDAIYKNSPYGDSFVVMMLLDGTLYPSLDFAYLEPDQDSTLAYTNTQGRSTTVQVSAGAVSESTMLVYAEVETTAMVPISLAFAGQVFELTAYRDYRLMSDTTFSKPVTITVHYSDADIANVDENTLELRYWNGNEWSTDGITLVERDTAQNYVVFTIEHLTEFALIGEKRYQIYLPIVLTQ